ncbi:hypothetical protein SARC_05820 [Sphaeroforma arctica JP610]|uniref:Uncharacterized protein n=1 Tax=Sphaeroforma arctica JP610 TaxID=667725 RepID=A0A0L0FZ12_9EUKA|nr:hypothetical protein SARC_05820 [Sphaeroforma arctica JP610]KNC81874.1 hypothetical protein SARC_05820 [Sphaeroforma arctica JP610]|eukprot:XP_014155776.1 hypothetical protein SARC_05820 [Sphaeroforma arctica JP610]
MDEYGQSSNEKRLDYFAAPAKMLDSGFLKALESRKQSHHGEGKDTDISLLCPQNTIASEQSVTKKYLCWALGSGSSHSATSYYYREDK